MSADPQQPTEPLSHLPNPVPRDTAWPQQPPGWPQQPPAWPQPPPQPPVWQQQSPAASPPWAWPQQPPAASPPHAWPSATPPGQGMPGHCGYGWERYQAREQPRSQYWGQYPPAQQAQEWAPLPLHGQEMYAMTVAPKSPAASVLLSVFIPGLGSMVNGNAGVGVTILILNIIGWILAIALIGIPLAIGSWVWGLVDAHHSAQRWNRRHGIIS